MTKHDHIVPLLYIFFTIFPCCGYPRFLTPRLGSYSYEGLEAPALFEPAADRGRVSARCVRVCLVDSVE